MPLNVQNKTYVALDEELKPQPIPQTSPKSYSNIRYFFMGFYIVVVVSSTVFLVYIFSLRHQIINQPPQKLLTVQMPDTSKTVATQPSEQAIKIETTLVQPESQKFIRGAYVVYIAAYITEPPATDEVSRWSEAGYDASIVESNKHFCVALGHYATVTEARTFAELMWEAFENGYFIGKVQLQM